MYSRSSGSTTVATSSSWLASSSSVIFSAAAIVCLYLQQVFAFQPAWSIEVTLWHRSHTKRRCMIWASSSRSSSSQKLLKYKYLTSVMYTFVSNCGGCYARATSGCCCCCNHQPPSWLFLSIILKAIWFGLCLWFVCQELVFPVLIRLCLQSHLVSSQVPATVHCNDELLRPNDDKLLIGSREPIIVGIRERPYLELVR
jgi:hypothetical protein